MGGGLDGGMGGALSTSLCPLAGVERVLHEHRDGHRSHAAGGGRDGFAERGHGVEVDVADDTIAVLLGGVRDAIDTHVDDDRSRFDHVGGDETRFADRSDDDVGLADDAGKVSGARMSDGHGTIATFGQEEGGSGLADDERAADDDGVFTGGFDAGATEKFDDARGRAGGKGAGDFLNKAADALSAEAIDVLIRGYAVEYFRLGQVLG